MSKSLPCDVVLLPGADLRLKAIEASKLLEQFDTFFTLEEGKFYPHVSLYMFQLNEADISRVEETLARIAEEFNIISGKADRYSLGKGHGIGYIDPEYEVTSELSNMQDTVIELINPVRAGMREKDVAKMQDARGLKLENLQNFGYAPVGKLFRPHITLTRTKEHKPEVLDSLPAIETFDGFFDRIGLFEMGDNGTCIRKIAEFELS